MPSSQRTFSKLILTQQSSWNFKYHVFIHDLETRDTKTNFRKNFDFYNSISIQVGCQLYAFKEDCNPAQWVSYSDLNKENTMTNFFKETPLRPQADNGTNVKETPPTPRAAPSLANFNDSHILVIGGKISGNYSQTLATVDMYDVEMDSWWKPPS